MAKLGTVFSMFAALLLAILLLASPEVGGSSPDDDARDALLWDSELETLTTDGDEDASVEVLGQANDDDDEFDMSKVEVYGDGVDQGQVEIDCSDLRFMDSIECLFSPADANLSKDGLRARNQLLSSMELVRSKRQADTTQDEGSGNGNIYPDDTVITNGTYVIDSIIKFSPKLLEKMTEDELNKGLTKKLEKAFEQISAVTGLNVTGISVVNGTLVAHYQIRVSGNSVSGYGSNLENIQENLAGQLANVTTPLFNTIELEGESPLEPFNPTDFSEQVGTKIGNICETENPCPDSFEQCEVTGVDEGKCLHLCTIFEGNGQCEHGGTCELDQDGLAFCSCTNNWEGEKCQDKIRGKDLNKGEIAGTTVGAMLAVVGVVGLCAWMLLGRKGTKNMTMTQFSDDSSNSDHFSSPSSKISTFVIDRPRISSSPINAFNPGNHGGPRAKPSLFSDA